MESGETYDGQSYPVETPKSVGSLQLPPLYFNTTDNPTSTAPSPSSFPQYRKSPGLNSGPVAPPVSQPYNDPYRYQRHVPSPGTGRMLQRPLVTPGWQNAGSPVPPHMSYIPADRSRYMHQPYPGYDPSKPYGAPPQTVHPPPGLMNQPGTWSGQSYSPSHSSYPDMSGPSRHIQPEIAGPSVPAGLQALQANNNNATLMQHQHTPMLVPNPHYNQSRAQVHSGPMQHPPSQKNIQETSTQDHDKTPQRSIQEMAPAEGALTPSYYSTHSTHMPPSNIGPIHHQVGAPSPNVSPYPSSTTTPGSSKSKARGNKCYQCPKCVKIFRRGDHLKRHLLSVHDHEHPYQCGECGKGFASVPTLSKHAKSLHLGAMTKGLMCLRCHLSFTTIKELDAHAVSLHVQEDEQYMQNINTSSKQHLCNTCSKAFSSGANLKRHMQLLHRTKDETKLFCRECGKGFSRTDNLRKHVDRVHFGNPNAMPDIDEHDNDMDSLSQTHSSESDSRGPSIDTDESSLSAPPSNTMQRYPPTQPQQQIPPPTPIYQGGSSHTNSSPTHALGYQAQYSKSNHIQSPAPPVQSSPKPNQYPVTLSQPQASSQAPATVTLGHVPQHQLVQSNPSVAANDKMNKKPATTTAAVTEMHASPAQVTNMTEMRIPMENHNQRIEPKSVSEALSMAMKALSDFDYESPGCETYPTQYPRDHPATPQAQTNIPYIHQNYSYYSMTENGGMGAVSSPRPPDGVPVMHPQYNPNYQRQDGNFLMTMPPPPGSMTMGSLLPQPPMAGVQGAPQLSRLLQEGGGGVKSPMIINNNNNCNTIHEANNIMPDQSAVPKNKGRSKRAKKKQKINDENEEFRSGEDVDGWKDDNSENGSNFSCHICNIAYENIDNLMIHIEGIHLKKNPHECCICHKKFAQAGNVKRHIRFVHLRERPFRCKDCSSTFDRLCYLQRHMRSHLQPDDSSQDFDHLKPCSCPECGKKCLTAHHLRGHMQRKHFAKNKQNYGQFLMKYRHLEAIGAGPGAISNNGRNKRGGRKRKPSGSDTAVKSPDGDQIAIGNIATTESHFTSQIPYSSMPVTAASTYSQVAGIPTSNIGQHQYVSQANYNPYQTQMQMNTGYVTQNGSHTGTMAENQMDTLQAAVSQALIPTVTPIDKILFNGMMPQVETDLENVAPLMSYFPNFMQKQEGQIGNQMDIVGFKDNSHKHVKRHGTRGRKSGQKLLPYRCTHCVYRSFANLPLLKSHLSLVHKTMLKRSVCLPCGMSYSSPRRLRSHMYSAHHSKKKKIKKRRRQQKKTRAPSQNNPATVNQSTMSFPGYRDSITSCYPAFSNGPMPNGPPRIMSYHHPLYDYNTSTTSMVNSPNVQAGYANPGHHISTPLSLVQT